MKSYFAEPTEDSKVALLNWGRNLKTFEIGLIKRSKVQVKYLLFAINEIIFSILMIYFF